MQQLDQPHPLRSTHLHLKARCTGRVRTWLMVKNERSDCFLLLFTMNICSDTIKCPCLFPGVRLGKLQATLSWNRRCHRDWVFFNKILEDVSGNIKADDSYNGKRPVILKISVFFLVLLKWGLMERDHGWVSKSGFCAQYFCWDFRKIAISRKEGTLAQRKSIRYVLLSRTVLSKGLTWLHCLNQASL